MLVAGVERQGRLGEFARLTGHAPCGGDTRETEQRLGVGLLMADSHPLFGCRRRKPTPEVHVREQLPALTLAERAALEQSEQGFEGLEVLHAQQRLEHHR